MALRKIVTTEEENILRKKCRKVEKFDSKLHDMLDDMVETMKEADGVGLAGPQVGILRQIVVIDIDDDILELINPEIIKTEGEQINVEGCLSCPGVWGYVKRPETVTVRAYDRNGQLYEMTGKDLLARAFCHEIDHLSGVLFTDKVLEYYYPEETTEEDK